MDLFDEIKETRERPTLLLHGTDWWTDADDVLALRLLLNAHKAGIVRLLGIGINSLTEKSAPSVSAFCGDMGLEIPIGVDVNALRAPDGCRYQARLAKYPHKVRRNEDCPEAYRLYRKALAEAPYKVEITEVGFPQILMQLLDSGPDEFSPLTGTALVKEKVRRIWMMAGCWNQTDFAEYNLSAYPVNAVAGDRIVRLCPVPIVFLGFEVGFGVTTGRNLPENDLAAVALSANGRTDGNFSWDPMTVLCAIEGDPEKAGYRLVRGQASVDPKTGVSSMRADPEGLHAYLVKTQPDGWYEARIEALLQKR